MIYASFSTIIFCDNYKDFCFYMEIPTGEGAAKRRTPAESRTVAQFLIALNSGRSGVFVNFNHDLAVVLKGDSNGRSKALQRDAEVAKLPAWELLPYSFDLGYASDTLSPAIAKMLRMKLDMAS